MKGVLGLLSAPSFPAGAFTASPIILVTTPATIKAEGFIGRGMTNYITTIDQSAFLPPLTSRLSQHLCSMKYVVK
jgi:hypothetical protein